METNKQFDIALQECEAIFFNKLEDYGASWRLMRTQTVTDQLLIKANRIKQIEETGVQQIKDSLKEDVQGLVNYAAIYLYQANCKSDSLSVIRQEYLSIIRASKELMTKKNSDYDEIWRKMRVTSYTDLILCKLLRIKQIEDKGVQHSEGIQSNIFDILNYSIFYLIRLEEKC